jgi:AmiR/NasT family two-component response regulator
LKLFSKYMSLLPCRWVLKIGCMCYLRDPRGGSGVVSAIQIAQKERERDRDRERERERERERKEVFLPGQW